MLPWSLRMPKTFVHIGTPALVLLLPMIYIPGGTILVKANEIDIRTLDVPCCARLNSTLMRLDDLRKPQLLSLFDLTSETMTILASWTSGKDQQNSFKGCQFTSSCVPLLENCPR
jgi:hypothetical protein